MESNERYYRRRAVEERMAAQRAVTETARAWHSKLAQDFAERASASMVSISSRVNGSKIGRGFRRTRERMRRFDLRRRDPQRLKKPDRRRAF